MNKKVSQQQEERVAEVLGLYTVRGSGAVDFHKGDVVGDDILIECKTKIKESKSHSLKKEWFTKVKEQAFGMGKYRHALAFDFGDGEDYIAIPIEYFRDLLELEEELNERG